MVVLKQFGILFVLGSLGIVLLAFTSIPLARQQLAALPPEIAAELPPLPILILQQGLQIVVLLAIAILIGIACTRPVGLHSHLLDAWVLHTPKLTAFTAELKWSLGLGAATTVIVWIIDYGMNPLLPEALRMAKQAEPHGLTTLTAILYGGITEEILIRWGLMSLLIWGGWKLLRQGITLPSQGIYQGAIAVTAVIFGLGHLPATATIAPLTPWVILRAILLNGIPGIAYGWLFWQYSLEAAMIAHASFHVWDFCLNSVLTRLVAR
ncbi:MAG: CPBP family intramembrane metalloprotease [Aphanocapsa sp. GSE-SYN-MK-11-07L]|jgi:hypothetical protein|nr:CPBP family intramembrane metalloprotease [Aphanocapsa sp. GSE-SYN-MK-11-07L]